MIATRTGRFIGILGLAVSLLVGANAAHAARFRFAGYGGMGLPNKNANDELGLYEDANLYTETSETLGNNIQAGGDLGLMFKRWGFRGTFMYQQTALKEGDVTLTFPVTFKSDVTHPKWKSYSPGLDLFFWLGKYEKEQSSSMGIPIFFDLIVGGGGEYHIVKYENLYDSTSGTDDTLKATGGAFGWKAFGIMQIRIGNNLGIMAEGGYRGAIVKEFKADEAFQQGGSGSIAAGSVVKKSNATVGTAFDGSNLTLNLTGPYFVGGISILF